jgi:hypothetical protein
MTTSSEDEDKLIEGIFEEDEEPSTLWMSNETEETSDFVQWWPY